MAPLLQAVVFVFLIFSSYFTSKSSVCPLRNGQESCGLLVDYSESFCTTSCELFVLFDHIYRRSADSLNCRQRLYAAIAYSSKTNVTLRIDLRPDLVSVCSPLLLSGDVLLNPGPACQPNKVRTVIQ